MKTTYFSALATVTAAASFFTASAPVHASPWVEFTLSNATSQHIVEFNATNVGSHVWGPDLLGTHVIRPGQSVSIDPDDGSNRCRYDMRAVMDNGQELTRRNVNLCETTHLMIGRR